jgi:nicotinamidase-related amidase
LLELLNRAGAKKAIFVGSSTNIAVLYTCRTAARVHDFDVVLPLDGINTRTQYEHDYSIHQFTVLPHDPSKKFHFTELSLIAFQSAA